MEYATVIVILNDHEQHSLFVSETKIAETMEICRSAVAAGILGFVVVHNLGLVAFHDPVGKEVGRMTHPVVEN